MIKEIKNWFCTVLIQLLYTMLPNPGEHKVLNELGKLTL